MFPAASGFNPQSFPTLPPKSQTPPKRDPIWTALDPVSIRFGHGPEGTDAVTVNQPEASPSEPVASPPKEQVTPTEAPSVQAAPQAPVSEVLPETKSEDPKPEKPKPEALPAKPKLPLGQRVKRFLKNTTWGLFGLSSVLTVGAPVAHLNRPEPTVLVQQSEESAQLWKETQAKQGATASNTTLQKMAIVSYMADLADKAALLNPEQPNAQLLTGFNLNDQDASLMKDLVAEAKKTQDFQGTLALYNRFADSYLAQYNSKEVVEQSKTNVAKFFAENKKELSTKNMWDAILLNAFLYGLGGVTVTGSLLALTRKKK